MDLLTAKGFDILGLLSNLSWMKDDGQPSLDSSEEMSAKQEKKAWVDPVLIVLDLSETGAPIFPGGDELDFGVLSS